MKAERTQDLRLHRVNLGPPSRGVKKVQEFYEREVRGGEDRSRGDL